MKDDSLNVDTVCFNAHSEFTILGTCNWIQFESCIANFKAKKNIHNFSIQGTENFLAFSVPGRENFPRSYKYLAMGSSWCIIMDFYHGMPFTLKKWW